MGIGTAALAAFSELEGVQAGFDRLNNGNLLSELQDATNDTVNNLDLMKSAVQANNFKIPLTELAGLFDFARRRAKETGENVDFLVNSIVTGIGRKSPLILDNLGISASALKDELGGAAVASSSIGDITQAVGAIAGRELEAMGEDAQTLKETYLQLKATITNSFGEIGGIIAEAAQPLIEGVRDIANRFKELSPETKRFIVILGGIAAAAGPLLVLAGTILPAIGTGLALLTGPIGLVVAGVVAIGVAVVKNLGPIREVLTEIANYFIDLYNESIVFRFGVEAIISAFRNLFAVGKFVFEALGSLVSLIADNIKTAFVNVGDLIKAVLTGNVLAIPDILAKGFTEGLGNAKTLIADLDDDFENLKNTIGDNISEGINNALRGKKYELLSSSVDASGVEDAVSDAVASGLQKGVGTGLSGDIDLEIFDPKDVEDFITSLGGRVDEAISNANVGTFDNVLSGFVDSVPDDFFIEETERLKVFSQELEALRETADRVGNSVGDVFFDLANSLVDSLGLAESGFEGFLKNLAQTVVKLLAITLSQSIANAISGATAAGAATGPASIFTTPAFIATAVGGVLSAFAAIPKFFSGGIVGGNSFTGDRNLVRVNSGELILNAAQQKNLAGALSGGSSVILQPSLDVSGDRLRVLLNRVDTRNNRLG